jgi:hypothetical protein
LKSISTLRQHRLLFYAVFCDKQLPQGLCQLIIDGFSKMTIRNKVLWVI